MIFNISFPMVLRSKMNTDVHFSSKSDEWETPQKLYDKLNEEFHFTLDPASTVDNTKCDKFFTMEEDGLKQSWKDEIVFMNPPYGRKISLWMEKAYEESKHATVVCLIPARTDTGYFHDYCMKASEIRLIKGRLKFINRVLSPMGENDSKVSSAPFPSAIVVFNGTSSDGVRVSSYTV